MYYLIRLNDYHFVGKACEQLASQENAFKFTSRVHAENVLDAWQVNHPNARLLEVNEWERCVKPALVEEDAGEEDISWEFEPPY